MGNKNIRKGYFVTSLMQQIASIREQEQAYPKRAECNIRCFYKRKNVISMFIGKR